VKVGSPMLLTPSVGVWISAFWSMMPAFSMTHVP